MAEWVPIQDGNFIAADVIRWKEWVYRPRRSRKARAIRLGDQLVTAEVIKEPDDKGWTRLLVRRCEILTEFSVKKLTPIYIGTEVKRSIRTIMRGQPERLLWSDESARAIVKSKFLGIR